MRDVPLILVVDDIADNREIVAARLQSHGYEVAEAEDGETALAMAAKTQPDLILLDVMMPRLDGIEVVKRLKADASLPFIPVILLTSKSDVRDVVSGLEAGADDYLTKPIDHAALVARVKAMLRLKALQDRISEQAAELAELNRTLATRVAEQVAEIERMSRLKRFLSPPIVEAVLASPHGEGLLDSHRAEITVLFTDLRGFTSFAETAEPEDVMRLLREYHAIVGVRVNRHNGTLERFAGDGIMVFFNDPLPCADHCAAAVALAYELVEDLGRLLSAWNKRGADLGVGVGIAAGYATLGTVGFEERLDYAAIGTVTNLAARLCEQAAHGQVLVSGRVAGVVNDQWPMDFIGDLSLKGFHKPAPVYELRVKGAKRVAASR